MSLNSAIGVLLTAGLGGFIVASITLLFVGYKEILGVPGGSIMVGFLAAIGVQAPLIIVLLATLMGFLGWVLCCKLYAPRTI